MSSLCSGLDLAATLIPADCINRDKLSELAAIQTARVLDPVAYLRVLAGVASEN
jgi:hypothetical protein